MNMKNNIYSFSSVHTLRKKQMARIIKVLVPILLVVPMNAFAVEEVFVDFALLTADTPVENPIHNSSTLLGFSDLYPTNRGVSLSDSEKELVQLSLAIPQWNLIFNSSARQPSRILSSGILATTVDPSATENAGLEVLGTRIKFVEDNIHSWALIEPPYRIPRLASGSEADFSSRGLITNVDQIRSISLEAYGLNYPHRVSVLFEDVDGIVKERMLAGTLDFTGWNTLTWNNTQYVPSETESGADVVPVTDNGATSVEEIALSAEEIRLSNLGPVYPNRLPVVAFRGMRIWKDGSYLTGDFVGYFKEIRIDYDPLPGGSDDFDHEAIWNIVGDDMRRQTRIINAQKSSTVPYQIIQSNIKN